MVYFYERAYKINNVFDCWSYLKLQLQPQTWIFFYKLWTFTIFGPFTHFTMVLWSNLSCNISEGWGFKFCRHQKYFSIQINKNVFAEVRADEKGYTLTHCVSQSSSSHRKRGDKKRKRKNRRHHSKHQSYVVALL